MNDRPTSLLKRLRSAGPWISAHRGLVFVLVGAFALRLAIALTMTAGFGDQDEYLSGANRLLDGEPLPILNNMVFVRSPGYSLFIAAIWAISPGRTLVAVRLAQAVLSTATCALTYALALRIRDDLRIALVAACINAIYPYFLSHVATVGSECLFAFLVVLGTYLFARAVRQDGILWGYLAGGVLVYAAGILVRPNLAPTEAVLGLFLAWRYRRKPRTVVAAAVVMVAGTLLVTAPWSLAVERQGLGWVFSSDGGGAWYYVGHCDLAVRVYCEHTEGRERAAIIGTSQEMDPVLFVSRTLPRSEHARFFWRTALHWDSEHLSDQLCLATGKFWNYWRPWVEPHVYSRALFAASVVSLPLLLLGLVGLWRLRSSGDPALSLVVAANVVGGTITAMVYSTQIRYRIPVIDPLLVPYAACLAIDLLRDGMARRRAPPGYS
jgi:4-amino-4-deoxy-L-arabinose transferase-like glycosyltransferase